MGDYYSIEATGPKRVSRETGRRSKRDQESWFLIQSRLLGAMQGIGMPFDRLGKGLELQQSVLGGPIVARESASVTETERQHTLAWRAIWRVKQSRLHLKVGVVCVDS
jgi:hypothetical protein